MFILDLKASAIWNVFVTVYLHDCFDHLQQITALKKENFNLKLRIYFMEERMQQKCDDSTEDIFKTVWHCLIYFTSFSVKAAEFCSAK